MEKFTANKANLIGASALFIWAVEPLMVAEVSDTPLFENLFIMFFSAFLITAIKLTVKRRWHIVKNHSILFWLAGITGICGSDFAYLLAADCAPIAHVDLIDYIWPCMLMVFVGLMPKEKFNPQYFIGAMLGMLAIVILMYATASEEGNFNIAYLQGYALALYGAMLWGGYAAYSRYHKDSPTEMIGIFCGVGAALSLILHLKFETFVYPSNNQFLLIVALGTLNAGFAYQLWNYGIKHGDINFLSILTYIFRILASILLVICGKEPLSASLVAACGLATFAVFVSNIDRLTIKIIVKKVFPAKTLNL